jgi:hypothetical protein
MSETLEVQESGGNHRYDFVLRALGLSKEDIHGQKIVDVGCGEGLFVSGALADGADAYGIDSNISTVPPRFKARGSHHRIAEHNYLIPFPKRLRGADKVVSFTTPEVNEFEIALQEQDTRHLDIREDFYVMLTNMLRATKNGGEVRLGPFLFVPGLANPELMISYHSFFKPFCEARHLPFEFIQTGIVKVPNSNPLLEAEFHELMTLVIHKPLGEEVRE